MLADVFLVSVLSGFLQALGYLIYIRLSLRGETDPNPTTWFMFSYGTLVLTVLEYDRAENFTILFLPIVCAFYSMRVAIYCFKQGTLRWPKHDLDRLAIVIDLVLTVGYVVANFRANEGEISEYTRNICVLVFLVLTNVSTIVSFIPLLRGVRDDPKKERPLPWFVWTTAYACLGWVTYQQYGFQSVLMLYPVSNVFLHASVGLLACRKKIEIIEEKAAE